MSKKNRQHAPRDRKRPISMPKPPCTPDGPHYPPPPVRPSGPGCSTLRGPGGVFQPGHRGRY